MPETPAANPAPEDRIATLILAIFDSVQSIEYRALQEVLDVDWDTLNTALWSLELSSLIRSRRSYDDIGPCTWFSATRSGRRRARELTRSVSS